MELSTGCGQVDHVGVASVHANSAGSLISMWMNTGCMETTGDEGMSKTTKDDYMAALEEANQEVEGENENPVLSEAEQLAAHAEAPRRRVDGSLVTSDKYRNLTAQQHAFVMGVVQGKTLRQAYKDAYPNDTSTDSAISTSANKLFKHPRVQVMLEDAWGQITENLVDDVSATKRYVMKQLLEHSKQAKQEGSKLKALELLGKASGLFVQQTATDEVTLTAEQLKAELSGHLRLVKQRRSSAVQGSSSSTGIIDVNAKAVTAV